MGKTGQATKGIPFSYKPSHPPSASCLLPCKGGLSANQYGSKMQISYSYKFIHHTNLVMTSYKFIVYCVYTPNIYDVVNEIDGQQALRHYQAIQKATPQQLQCYLEMIGSDNYNKRLFLLVTKSEQLPPIGVLLRVMRARSICGLRLRSW